MALLWEVGLLPSGTPTTHPYKHTHKHMEESQASAEYNCAENVLTNVHSYWSQNVTNTKILRPSLPSSLALQESAQTTTMHFAQAAAINWDNKFKQTSELDDMREKDKEREDLQTVSDQFLQHGRKDPSGQ